ncbi:DHA2 family efflux MFS transporter permease subunit [Bacillus sp. SCS-151]|uniref:DHA2 family efflux MFS transporter permease subunit n=1 Tax=Nanhaiella sioensis TaxID=3115293 RepID=UPI00397A6C5F
MKFKRFFVTWGILLASLSGAFAVLFNGSLMNVALPYFTNLYKINTVTGQWIITAFPLAMAITMPLIGYLQKKMGDRPLYLTGSFIFTFGSIAGSFSWDLYSLIFFRSIQGFGAGLIMPLTMVFIFKYFPSAKRGFIMGIWGVVGMIAPTIGPTISGSFLNINLWQGLFFINLPIITLTIVFSFLYIPNEKEKIMKSTKFDVLGYTFLTLSLICILVGANMGNSNVNNSPLGYYIIVSGIILLIVFCIIQFRVKNPLLDLSVFKNLSFTISLLILAASTISLYSVILFIPIYLQEIMQLSPLIAGLILLPQALFMGISMTIGGKLLDLKGPKVVLLTGLLSLSVVTYVLSYSLTTYSLVTVVVILIIQGFCNGLINTPATTLGLNSLSSKLLTAGSTINNLWRQLVKVFSVLLLTIYYEFKITPYPGNPQDHVNTKIHALSGTLQVVALIIILCVPLTFILKKNKEEN